jgi:hypothetical protein
MMLLIRPPILVCLLLFGIAPLAVHAGMNATSPYADRGQADFDTFLQLLNPYGTWSKIGSKWAFTPTDHLAPYTSGRWIYTEYGWYWKGNLPHSWATEHYGYWKRGDDKVWSWYPGPFWLPEIVELRQTDKYIGWRSGEVDEDGGYVEPPIDRYTKSEEWTFVRKQQFANPITPAEVAPSDVARTQLDDSVDSHHTFLTYREIDRPGPHPADELMFCNDGAMVAPKSMEELAAAAAAEKAKQRAALNPYTAKMTGTTQPQLLDATAEANAASGANGSGGDTRKVKYWVTMSLPKFWSKPPAEAKEEEIYLYRPDLYQDNDGIQRRVTLWFNPQQRTTLKELMTENAGPAASSAAPASAGVPTPAIPAASSASSDAFHSPLDDSYHGSAPSRTTNSAASKGAVSAVPTGVAAPAGANAPAP